MLLLSGLGAQPLVFAWRIEAFGQRQYGAVTHSHLDVHPKGALLTEGDHQPLSAVAEVELSVD